MKDFKENLVNKNQQLPFLLTGTSSGSGCKIRTRLWHGHDEFIAEDEEEEPSDNQPSAGMGYLPLTPADSDDDSDNEGRFYVTTHCVIAARRAKLNH